MDIRFYIKYPGGRQKIAENVSDEEAIELFNNHWAQKDRRGGWLGKNPEKILVKETREDLIIESLVKEEE